MAWVSIPFFQVESFLQAWKVRGRRSGKSQLLGRWREGESRKGESQRWEVLNSVYKFCLNLRLTPELYLCGTHIRQSNWGWKNKTNILVATQKTEFLIGEQQSQLLDKIRTAKITVGSFICVGHDSRLFDVHRFGKVWVSVKRKDNQPRPIQRITRC